MTKTKAIFAAVIVVIVAGLSVLFWYLNENGVIDSKENESDSNLMSESTAYDNDSTTGNEFNDDTTAVSKEEETQENNQNAEIAQNEVINEFLSVFSRTYFSENKEYSEKYTDTYELIRFAYAYTSVNNPSLIKTEHIDDDIGYYYAISADTVNDVLMKYLGITVGKKSVFTEDTYTFFRYSDGSFYMPAADGLGYVNVAIADSVIESDDTIAVEFSIYSAGVTADMTSRQAKANGEKYASGRAEIAVKDGNYILSYYKITQ